MCLVQEFWQAGLPVGGRFGSNKFSTLGNIYFPFTLVLPWGVQSSGLIPLVHLEKSDANLKKISYQESSLDLAMA